MMTNKSNGTSCRLGVFVALFLAAAGVSAAAVITDARWYSMNNDQLSGTEEGGEVYAVAFCKGNIYIGGMFSAVGNTAAANIARWDGSTWNPLGAGTNGDVNRIVCDTSGNLFACGRFTMAGVRGVARWDGKNWSALPTDNRLLGTVMALACDTRGNLYAGGGPFTPWVMKWDGTKWDTLGQRMAMTLSNANGQVNFLSCDSAGNLYASGRFDSAGGHWAKNIAKWNGVKWDSLGTTTDSVFSAFTCDNAGNLYGARNSATGRAIVKWNKSAWNTLGTARGLLLEVKSLFWKSNSELYACGRFDTINGIAATSIGKWNGTVWSSVGSAVDGGITVNSVAFDTMGNLYAGGKFSYVDKPVNNIVQWNGTSWNSLGHGPRIGIDVLACDNTGNLFAGGGFDTINGVRAKNIAQWNGSVWTALGSGINGGVGAIACDSSGNVFAGGNFDSAGGIRAPGIAKWDGSHWSSLGSGILGPLQYVMAIAFDRHSNLYAGGSFSTAGGVPANNIAKWDGSTWSALGSGANDVVEAIALDSNDTVFMGGDFDSVGGDTIKLIAQWDGSHWSRPGKPELNAWVSDLTVNTNGELFIYNFSYVRKWNGTLWTMLTEISDVNSMAHDENGNVYVGGRFTYVGGGPFGSPDSIPANNIVMYDGKNWSPLASGIGADAPFVSVNAIAVYGTTLYAAGQFCKAGEKFANGIARLDMSDPSAIALKTEPIASNAIRFRLSQSTLVLSNIARTDCVSLYSLSGRCIREAQGVSRIKLSGLAPQPLIVRVSREGRIVSSGMVIKQ
jgi:hypothetical protein